MPELRSRSRGDLVVQVHIDVPKSGGLLESKKIADLADMFYMPVCAHIASSPLGFMASAHCAAAVGNFKAHEHSVGRFSEAWEKFVIHGEPLIKDGRIQIPDKPGLGVELNEDQESGRPRFLRSATESFQSHLPSTTGYPTVPPWGIGNLLPARSPDFIAY